MKLIKASIFSIALFMLLITPYYRANAQSGITYTVNVTTDKTTVNPGDEFNITITAKNTSASRINNFELRVPFARTIQDATLQGESPSFNKILENIEYPAGFNSRSWLINSFDPNETGTFTLKYKVTAEPKTPSGLVSNITLPITWVDPAGYESNKLLIKNNFRVDAYINRQYSNSAIANLPTLQSLSTPLSLVTLNAKYLETGSKTTNLKSVTPANIKALPNFVLESADLLIEWTGPIDLSAANVPAQLTNLDANLTTEWGKISFVESNLPFLANKPVKVTFKNANFIFAPKIRIGQDTKSLSEAKGNFTVGTKNITIDLEKLSNIAISPEIQFEQAVIETDKENYDLQGKVADPRSQVSYTINGETRTITAIDLSTGAFTIPVKVNESSVQIEITTKYKNNEDDKKVVIVRRTQSATPTPTPQNSRTISEPVNQITIGLILAATGLLAIIGGIIYFLYRSRHKAVKKPEIDLNPVVLGKISSIGNKPEVDSNPNISNIDLAELKKKYEVDKDKKEK